MIMAVLIDYRISILINIINLILVSIIVEFNPQFILMALLSIIVAVSTLKRANQRNDILYSTVYVGIVAAIVVFATGMLFHTVFLSGYFKLTFGMLITVKLLKFFIYGTTLFLAEHF